MVSIPSGSARAHLTATLQVELDLGDGRAPLRSREISVDADNQGSFVAPVAQLIVRLARQIFCKRSRSASTLPPEFQTRENCSRRVGASPFPTASSGQDSEPSGGGFTLGESSSSGAESSSYASPFHPPLPCGHLVPEGPFCLAVRELAGTRGSLEDLPFVEPCHSSGSSPRTASEAAREGLFWCLRVRPTNFIDAICGHWLQCFLRSISKRRQHIPFFKKMPLEAFDRVARSLGWGELVRLLPSDDCCRMSFRGMTCVQVLQLLQAHFESLECETLPSPAPHTGFHAGVLCGSDCRRGIARLCVVPLSSSDTLDVLRQQVMLAGCPHYTGVDLHSSAKCTSQSVIVLAEPRDLGAHGEPAKVHGQVLVDDRSVAAQLWQKESGRADLRKLGSDGRKSLSEWRNEREPLPQGAHWEDPPLLQVVEHASATSEGIEMQHQISIAPLPALRRALHEEWRLVTSAQTAEEVRLTLSVLTEATHLSDPLGALSIEGLALASRAVGAPGCPEHLREAAADCLCRAFAETRLRGKLLEGVVQASKVRQGLACAIALAAQPPCEQHEMWRQMANSCFGLAGAILCVRQPQEQHRASGEELLKRRVECLQQHRLLTGVHSGLGLVSWRSQRLSQRPVPDWVESGLLQPSMRTLTQAAMALHNLHSHLTDEREIPQESEVLMEDLRVLARAARSRAARLQDVAHKDLCGGDLDADVADERPLCDAKEEAFLYQVLARACLGAEDVIRRSMAPRSADPSRRVTSHVALESQMPGGQE